MPTLIDNVRGNSTTLGVEDPSVSLGLLKNLQGLSESEKLGGNLMNLVDMGFLLQPVVGKAASIPGVLAGLGARKSGAAAVNKAIEETVAAGSAAAERATGVTGEQILDHSLPSIINPNKTIEDIPSPTVSLSGQVNAHTTQVEQAVKEWNLRGIDRMVPGEIEEAANSVIRDIEKSSGETINDYEIRHEILSNGQQVPYMEITGPGHSSQQEAFNWATLLGHGDPHSIEEQLVATGERKVRPQDEGFTDLAYHGTNDSFDSFDHGMAGRVTHDKDGAVYFTNEPDVAYSYSRNAAIEKTYKETGDAVTNAGFGNIRPTLLKTDNFQVEDMHGAGYNQAIHDSIIEEAREAGKDGVIFKNYDDSMSDQVPHPTDQYSYVPRTSTVYAVFDTDKSVRSAFEMPRIEQDMSGQYFPKLKINIPESGFYTQMDPSPTSGMLSRILNNSQLLGARLFDKAVASGNLENRLNKLIQKNLTGAFKQLPLKDRAQLAQVIANGQERKMWFNDEQLGTIYERLTGKPPSDAVKNAYRQYIKNNDIEWQLRNDTIYAKKSVQGYESVKFRALNQDYDVDAVVSRNPSVVPRERVYNVSEDVHYTTQNPLTDIRLKELREDGYFMVRSEHPIKLGDNTETNQLLIRKSYLGVANLRREQLAYSEGGHRLYAHKYFIKQASGGIQPDTGKSFLRNPNVFHTVPDVAVGRRMVRVYEEARSAVEAGKDAGYLDQQVFKGQKGFMSGQEFIDKTESGFISREHPFEVVYDRENPTAYSSNPDIAKFLDEDEVGFNGFYRTTGRMYTSAKGEHLTDHLGELAPTIDPFEAQNIALNNVARMSSFDDFKTSAVDRWLKNYSRFTDRGADSSPMTIFTKGEVKADTPELTRQINAQRDAIKRILRFQTPFDRAYNTWMRSMTENILGDGENPIRSALSKGVNWFSTNNPRHFLAGLATDAKLGMFNVGQLFTQTGTMFSALSLSPKFGSYGLASAMPVWSYFLSRGNEGVLDQISKAGIWKLAGMQSEKEFKEYVRYAHETGFFDLGDTHVMVNNFGLHTTFGSLGGTVDSLRQTSRMFFYNAEVLNRLVAHRIAWGEGVERFGKAEYDIPAFREFVAGRGENYSLNMSDASRAWWQNGLLSIPTQFWSYNVRMAEAMLGTNFTTAQKLRLAAFNLGAFGTGGIPIVAGLSEAVKEKYGKAPDIETMLGTFDRGLADRLIKETTGADILGSERWGTGAWSTDLIRDVFGANQYGDKPLSEILGGATFAITGAALGPVLGKAWQQAAYYAGHEKGTEPVQYTNDDWIKLASQVSTVGNALKAYMVYNYGYYKATTGSSLADHIPSQDAFAIALGFRPAELEDLAAAAAHNKNETEAIDDAAKVVKNWRQEAMNIPDKYLENSQKVNAFMNTLPYDMRVKVLRKTQKITDPSFYSGLLRRRNQEEAQEEIETQMEKANNGPDDTTTNP
jgi:hypothetical protein